MPQIIRKKLTPDEISPPNLIYDATCNCIQQTYDGGATWVNNPGADPRSADVFRYPPRGGTNRQCNAAANITANIEGQIFNSTNAISATGNAIAGVTILLQFLNLLGGWGVLAALLVDFCNLIVSVGVTGVQAAFTTTVYNQLTCIFFCNLRADGTLSAAGFAAIQSGITAQFGALSDVNIVMQGMLNYMGVVGLNNAGSIGTVVGSCGGCTSCEHCYKVDFTISNGGLGGAGTGALGGVGQYISGFGWIGITSGTNKALQIQMTLAGSADELIDKISVEFDGVSSVYPNGDQIQGVLHNGSTVVFTSIRNSVLGYNVWTIIPPASPFKFLKITHDSIGLATSPRIISVTIYWHDGALAPTGLTPNCP